MLKSRLINTINTTTKLHRFLNTRPAMSNKVSYDAIVVGSGQGGNPLAMELQKQGRKTAVIEAAHVGGCCVNEGCTPTKTMISSGRVAYLARRAGKDYGVHTSSESVQVDMTKVRQRKRDIVDSFRGGGETRLASSGVDVIMGTASFVSRTEISVALNDGGEKIVSSDLIFLNVGERPAIPKLEGLEAVVSALPERVLNSTTIQDLAEVPESLIVLGGGYIGLEFGQLFSRLGSKVTIVQRAERLVPREDPEITEVLQKILEEDGLDILVSSQAVKVQADSGIIELSVSSPKVDSTLKCTHLLLASGRTPNTDRLQIAKAGIDMNKRGYVITDENLKTNIEGIYAIGDVRGPPAFTHISYDDFRILRDGSGLFSSQSSPGSRQSITTKSREGLIPYVLYTDPQLGHVGLHLHEIPESERGDIQVASMPMQYVARALETDETRGRMKAVVNKKTGQILGFTCLGIEGGELMSVVQMAMMGNVKWWHLRDAVFAHPTIAECLNNLWGFLEDVQ